MKKLLFLATVGYVAYTLGRRAGNRMPVAAGAAQNAARSARDERTDDDESYDDAGDATLSASAESIEALTGVAAFDERQVSLANLALDRAVDAPTRSLATLLLEEHNTNLDRVRVLGSAVGVPVQSLESDELASDVLLRRLDGLTTDEFQDRWLSTVAAEHTRMLERIDDLWLPHTSDERIAEHLRLVRDDVEMHLQNTIAIGGPRAANGAR